ncbi:F0F1 ATP synthase subunit gamma [Pacificimonas flava]|uniref:ATP synthase gamma chain n=2 Tax=Pacificimonas TaxID=1960290 RepID=A0A219B364_9SPHN|nr:MULTISPECIES: F0F1 ATP synthase subunit gamma [Pacificimonas]MBZ6378092.1 F0F1 ATP synthase subunit gamma [Pacificimonas aurantium]OWV32268.1 F0F1 ATP synthase subunit gamma [Pacificimonas flava]
MASLKELKNRISSVKSTQKITKAKKMVAAAKLRRAQEAAEAARPYAEKMEAVLASLGQRVTPATASPLLTGTGKTDSYLLVVATSDRGLAGAFNANIVKKALAAAEQLRAHGKTVKFYLLGKKGRAVINRRFADDIVHFQDFSDIRNVDFDYAKAVADDILVRFRNGEFDVAQFYFSKFQSALVQNPTEQQIIPAPVSSEADGERETGPVEYEPSEEEILDKLLPRNIAVQIFTGLLENAASEQGASMTAMDNATRNAGDLINDLTIQYNRTRQAVITTELVEIISGAEAL